MTNKFKICFDKVIKNEGGYVNDPDDSGGETYKGIARKFWGDWLGWDIIDQFKNRGIQKEDFKHSLDFSLDLNNMVESFYKVNFWNVLKCDSINDVDVAFKIFDFGVNGGVKTSAKIAQASSGVKVDGIIGKMSIAAINSIDPELFLLRYTQIQIQRYVKICEKNRKNRKFFFGWIRRAIHG